MGKYTLKLPPLVVPAEYPREVMARVLGYPLDALEECAGYVIIKDILLNYQKIGDERSWDAYRKKVKPEEMLSKIEEILKECARNGFIAPTVLSDNRIVWKQVTTSGDYHSLDLCTLCERQCDKREKIDTGREKWKRQHMNNYQEPKACWEPVL